MKRYLKERYKNYVFVSLGVLIGLFISEALFDQPDYTTAMAAV
ncbi:hypothetical protein [Bacillus thermotolerans]|uniref:Uncharacterized protein n=1 Tax=Bacillus thermotolerans TaxID=1221996 RepID=A0A0F5HR85_BACTR|nr:hypothetical protein [Bacillus thermotolerans]KKB35357.1 hypothetical protein QY95_03491 [Bacillus thermotolerans]